MSVEKAELVGVIYDRFAPIIYDIEETSRGEMNLFSPSKNLRVMICNKQKPAKTDYEKFERLVESLKPAIALFVSGQDEIDYRIVQSSTCLYFYIHLSDLTKRFIQMLANFPTLSTEETKALKP